MDTGKRGGPRKGSRTWAELPIREAPAPLRRPSLSPAELEKQIEHATAKAEVCVGRGMGGGGRGCPRSMSSKAPGVSHGRGSTTQASTPAHLVRLR